MNSNIENTILCPSFRRGNESFQFSVHRCPKALKVDLKHVFPGDIDLKQMLVIPTMQKATVDLVGISDSVEAEKDRLLQEFVDFAREVCCKLTALGHWADFIDPCSGLAMNDPNPNRTYNEVEGAQMILNVMDAGCCKILLHPHWESAVYPATIFTTAPVDVAMSAFSAYI